MFVEKYAERVGVAIEIERLVVETEEDVQKCKFIGSPTVRINGLDVDTGSRGIKTYGFTEYF